MNILDFRQTNKSNLGIFHSPVINKKTYDENLENAKRKSLQQLTMHGFLAWHSLPSDKKPTKPESAQPNPDIFRSRTRTPNIQIRKFNVKSGLYPVSPDRSQTTAPSKSDKTEKFGSARLITSNPYSTGTMFWDSNAKLILRTLISRNNDKSFTSNSIERPQGSMMNDESQKNTISLMASPSPTKTQPAERNPEYFRFFLGKGNNDDIVRRVMKKRFWFRETSYGDSTCHFTWQQTTKGINFERMNANRASKQMVNHFEFHREISTKVNLIRNLQMYCEQHNVDLFDITPTTFILDFEDKNIDQDLQDFLKFFKKHSVYQNDELDYVPKFLPMIKNKISLRSTFTNISIKAIYTHSIPKMHGTFMNGCNLWLLKPTELNRGQGINLFNKLSTFKYYMQTFNLWENPMKAKEDEKFDNKRKVNMTRSTKFVVQKYLEKPLLIHGRKFDIRIWTMIDHEMNLYVFKEWYVRLSSELFNLSENNIDNQFIHLTNNAVQKYSTKYGKQEKGNIISCHEFKKFLPQNHPKGSYNKILGRMKDLIKLSMNSVRYKINSNDRKFCFEVFGYDFMVDSEYDIWLIEVNTNPCIEEPNDYLSMIVPRMLDDTFRITLDQIFTPTPKNYRSEDANNGGVDFPVDGYSNDELLWQCARKFLIHIRDYLQNLSPVKILPKRK